MKAKAVEVGHVMTRDVVSVAPDTRIKDVATVLTQRGISGVPVCDADGTVIGVLSEADLLVKQGGPQHVSGGLFAWLVDTASAPDIAKLRAHTAGEAMTTPAITVEAGMPVTQAARTMVERGVNRLPVVEDGRLVGIVTRADLVRAFVRTDRELADEIREHVLLKSLWIPPGNVNVAVDEGVVTLSGEVENRTTADMLPDLVRRVPGVVAVQSDVTWEDENGRR